MQKFKLITIILLLSTLFIGFSACSDDDDKEKTEHLIVGKWKRINEEGSLHTHVEFKSDKTFKYTSTEDSEEVEVGKWKIEGDMLYEWFSDQDYWSPNKIHELNSITLILEELIDAGETPTREKQTVYQRVN